MHSIALVLEYNPMGESDGFIGGSQRKEKPARVAS